ncbi:hypothetical protein ABIA41_004131 [Bradyrhizobium sp. USDA 313]
MHETQPGKAVALLRTSLVRAALALAVIACGLSLRWYGSPLGLPAFVVKYGGSLLWATMVFLLVAALLPRQSRMQIAAIAVVITVLVEFSRLVHTPWLDAFRLTMAGALLLGRIFSPWNLLAYLIGIVAGIWLDSRVGAGQKQSVSGLAQDRFGLLDERRKSRNVEIANGAGDEPRPSRAHALRLLRQRRSKHNPENCEATFRKDHE